MTEKTQGDFLDVLRFLNKENINETSELRHKFFQSLMVCADNSPEYLDRLSDAYFIEFEKEYMKSSTKNFQLSSLFGSEIERQLTDHMIQDKIDCLFIDNHTAIHTLTYVGAIKGMKNLIETSPESFDFFKKCLLQGLITRYCNDFVSGKNKNPERLNKLIVIYAEHIRGFDNLEEIPIIIDDDFLSELMDSRNNKEDNSKDSYYRAIDKLISRKFPINTSSYKRVK